MLALLEDEAYDDGEPNMAPILEAIMFRFFLLSVLLAANCLLGEDEQLPDQRRMVYLNVVALDNHGQPVTDLTRDDLQVTDSGKAQKISFFHHRDNGYRQADQLGPHEFSNRRAGNVPRATVILFDLLNQNFGTRGNTADGLIHALQSLEASEYVYLYLLTLNGRLYPVRGLPGPEGEGAPPGGIPWTRQIEPLLNQAIGDVTQIRPVGQDIAIRTQMTFEALDAMAAELSRVPGRKSIVWLTDGVPIELGPRRSDTGDFVDFTPRLRQMSEAFDRSAVSIYPVRPVMPVSKDVNGSSYNSMSSIETLNQLAGLTGGRPDAGNEIGAALRQSISDMRTSYQIGYYPLGKNWDNKFHKLKVTCTRKGLRIQSKTGYYAWKEAAGIKSEQAINAAIPTTFDAAEIGIRTKLSTDAKGSRNVRLQAHIDPHDVVLIHQGAEFLGSLRLAIVAYAPGQLVQRAPLIALEVRISAGDLDAALKKDIEFTRDLTLAEEISVIRLIVFDTGANAIGSVTMPLQSDCER